MPVEKIETRYLLSGIAKVEAVQYKDGKEIGRTCHYRRYTAKYDVETDTFKLDAPIVAPPREATAATPLVPFVQEVKKQHG